MIKHCPVCSSSKFKLNLDTLTWNCLNCSYKYKDSIKIEPIEKPMQMEYREAYAWQLGWDKGFEAGKEDKKEVQI